MGTYFETPVALIFFTRPETFEKVFAEVKKAKPKKLFLIQDGPRENRPDDLEKIMECRKIAEDIDWECEVFRNYSDVNLGCGQRPASGISWVFEHVDKAIILEDDCVPCETFFPYCEEMLNRYENDERIAYISGLNHFKEWDCGQSSYFFTKTGAIWGWATWKRAWDKYDYYVDAINDEYTRRLYKMQMPTKDVAEQKAAKLQRVNSCKGTNKKLSFWDAQWGMVKYLNHQLVIVPKYNQISNIGNGDGSTHFKKANEKQAKKEKSFFYIPVKKLELPLVHPEFCGCDNEYDARVYKKPHVNPAVSFARKVAQKFLKKSGH